MHGAGTISCVAGRGPSGSGGDGGPASAAELGRWLTIAVDAAGNVFIADLFAHRVRRVDAATGIISLIAGSGERGFVGDGGPALTARLGRVQGIAVDRQGNVFVADTENRRVRRVDASTARIETVAGNGDVGFPWLPNGDGGLATQAAIQKPTALAVDGEGRLFIGGWFSARVRSVEPVRGRIGTVAGTGVPGFGGEDQPAARTPIERLVQLASDAAGNLFVAETDAHRVRRIDVASGRIVTVAGTGRPGFSGDGGDATRALLAEPSGIAVDPQGNLYIADRGNHRIRRVEARTGRITTVAGNGKGDCLGRGGPALATAICPDALAVDRSGRLYFTDLGPAAVVMRLEPLHA
jgi:sugar lactone lactonase YvrE